jgi:hypothetical protein
MNSCLLSHVHHSSSFHDALNFKSDCITEHVLRCRTTQLTSTLGQSWPQNSYLFLTSSFAVTKVSASYPDQSSNKMRQNNVTSMHYSDLTNVHCIPLSKLLHPVVSSKNNRLPKRQRVNHGLSLFCYAADKGHLATVITDGKKEKKG